MFFSNSICSQEDRKEIIVNHSSTVQTQDTTQSTSRHRHSILPYSKSWGVSIRNL